MRIRAALDWPGGRGATYAPPRRGLQANPSWNGTKVAWHGAGYRAVAWVLIASLAVSPVAVQAQDAAAAAAKAKYDRAVEGAVAGDPEQMGHLGLALYFGEGVGKDHELARQWFVHGAERGNARCMNGLGIYYQDRPGIENSKLAVQWFEKAAAANYPAALLNLAVCHADGIGVPKDAELSFMYMRSAGYARHPLGMYRLGLCYLQGTGVTADPVEGVAWLRKADAAGSLEAPDTLAWCYLNGQGVAPDAAEAARLYQRAADAGYIPAVLHLGQLHLLGQGVAVDPARGVALVRRAAEAGDAEALFVLATWYEYGTGVERSLPAAAALYGAAAQAGHATAAASLTAVQQRQAEADRAETARLQALAQMLREQEERDAEARAVRDDMVGKAVVTAAAVGAAYLLIKALSSDNSGGGGGGGWSDDAPQARTCPTCSGQRGWYVASGNPESVFGAHRWQECGTCRGSGTIDN